LGEIHDAQHIFYGRYVDIPDKPLDGVRKFGKYYLPRLGRGRGQLDKPNRHPNLELSIDPRIGPLSFLRGAQLVGYPSHSTWGSLFCNSFRTSNNPDFQKPVRGLFQIAYPNHVAFLP
jgi:hypothetical protein